LESSSRKIAVIGSGAVGGFYGGLLSKSGCDVSFLIHSQFESVKESGLFIESIWGDFNLPQAKYVSSSKDFDTEIDIILIALKSTENKQLTELLRPFQNSRKKLKIILIQNGIGQEKIIHELLPQAKVFGGLAFLCSIKKSANTIQHIDYGDLTLAESSADETALGIGSELQDLGKLFQEAGITITLEEDLILARWKKLVWNIPFNGLSVLLQSQTNELVENSSSLELIRELMLEVQKAALSEGRIIPNSFLEDRLQKTFSMKPYPTSMKLDYDQGRSMELDAIYRSVLQRAESFNLNLPNIMFLLYSLEYLEKYRNDKK